MQPRRLMIIFTLMFVLFMLFRRASLVQHSLLVFFSQETFQISQRHRRRLLMLLSAATTTAVREPASKKKSLAMATAAKLVRVLLRNHAKMSFGKRYKT